ncbi:dethiobiotin synthase [Roseibacillus ishigakijimensis]|uniref:ATP-dependent dethiobiotin synthetase BioD n=1 Tax=Roseibacillus ishigakijimensis TaxID=454146 RepID=A0A934VLY5_9BACT|nr:dethiobiotin synthase [Roseibacillus ishigakijimensis]MBK1833390.1 dethiobiotin synthase [Roseibacillus ishigakijimensis]
MAESVIVTGTDTGCGKTWFSWLLVRALRARGIDAVGWKPFCCGDREDAYALADANEGILTLDEVNPVWFRTPIAPYPAAELEGGEVDLEKVRALGWELAARHEMVICEGVGGWEVPLTAQANFSTWAKTLGWPVLLVIGNRLGALNHTFLTARAIQEQGCALQAAVLNQVIEEQDVAGVTNRGVIEQRLPGQLLGEVMHGAEVLEDDLLEAFLQR